MEIFKNKKFNHKKLLDYGFSKGNDLFTYSKNMLNGDFKLFIEINSVGNIKTRVIETETSEEYTLHLTDAEGSFVGKIREEYASTLQNISDNCTEHNVFKSKYADNVINYIKTKYNDEIEYLWEKFPDNAIARRGDNSKWYIAILTVKKSKLGFESDEKVEIIDLREEPDVIPKLVSKGDIYPGYHMNKKHWITVILDGSVNIETIYKMIDKSYLLAKK